MLPPKPTVYSLGVQRDAFRRWESCLRTSAGLLNELENSDVKQWYPAKKRPNGSIKRLVACVHFRPGVQAGENVDGVLRFQVSA